MPPILLSLLQKTRVGILVMLLVVLPLQGVAQLVAGIHGHRHVHTGASQAAGPFLSPLRALLDQLHAAQDPRLQGARLGSVLSQGPAGELHEHGGVLHRHSHETADEVEVGDPADDSQQAGATAFLAWLPAALAMPVGEGGDRPAATALDWRDRVIAPPMSPPRG